MAERGAMSNGAKIALALVAGAGVFAGIVMLVPQRDGPGVAEDAPDVAAVAETEAEDAVVEEPVVEEAAAEEPATEEPVDDAVEVADVAAVPEVAPQVDTLRVEPDGMTVVAGRAAAGATVAVVIGGEVLAEVVADGAGAFVAMLDLPPSDQPRALTVVADPAGAAVESEGTFLVAPTVPEEVEVAALAEEPADDGVAVAEETVAEAEAGTAEAVVAEAEGVAATEDAPAVAVVQAQEAVDGESVAESPVEDVAETADVEPVAVGTEAADDGETGDVVASMTGVEEQGAETEVAAAAEETAEDVPVEEASETETVGVESVDVAEAVEPGAGDVVAAVIGADPAGAEDPGAVTGVDAPGVIEGADVAAPESGDVVAAVIGGEVPETTGDATVAQTPGVAEAEVPGEGDVVAAVIGGDASEAVAETDGPGVTETVGDGTGAETPGAAEVAEGAAEAVTPGVTVTEEVAAAETPGAETPGAEVPEAVAEVVLEVVPVVVDEAPGLVAPVAEEVTAPPVLVSDAEGVRVVQPALAPGAGPEVLQTVAVDAIAYDAEGAVDLSGRAAGGGTVRIYVDNAPIADVAVDADGQWKADLSALAPGVYTLRVDQLDETGAVTSRMETPFLREDRAEIAAVMAEETSVEGFELAVQTVQPGNTLWAIARDRYGDGVLYVKVFEANRDRIRNPDLIYPGQIFVLPEDVSAP